MPSSTVQQILVELSSAFGAEVDRGGCTLAPDTNAKCEEIFGKTVGSALGETPSVWTPSAERYVVKVVGRIAEDACVVARKLNGDKITAEILDDAASHVIAEQQLVCQRAEGMAAKKNPAGPVFGVFCKIYF